MAKKPGYRKLEDKEIDSDSISVIYLKKYKPLDGEICKNMNQFLIPKNLIDHKDDENTVRGFRVLDAIIQPRISGPVGFSLSAIMGLVRAYIIFAFIIFFVNTSVSIDYVSSLINESELIDLFNIGIYIIGDIPKRLDQIS